MRRRVPGRTAAPWAEVRSISRRRRPPTASTPTGSTPTGSCRRRQTTRWRRLFSEKAAPDISGERGIVAAASTALGIGWCVDDADDDDASLAAEKFRDCMVDFVTQQSRGAFDLPEDEDCDTDYLITYEFASTMIAQSHDTKSVPTDELMSETAWRHVRGDTPAKENTGQCRAHVVGNIGRFRNGDL